MADQDIDEIWRPILTYLNYEVSSLGRVRRAETGQLLKIGRFQQHRKTRPYAMICLRAVGQRQGTPLLVHRLVAKAFIPNPDNKPCVNHINFDISDARATNLAWCTHKENAAHSYLAGRYNSLPTHVGVNNSKAKLSEDDVRAIRKMSAEGMPKTKIAKLFGIDRAAVYRIVCRLQWKHVT